MKKTVLKTLAILVGAIGIITVGVGVANAGDEERDLFRNKCVSIEHDNVSDVTLDGTATATLTIDGVKVSTPAQDDRAKWKTDHYPVALSDIQEMSYRTYKMDNGSVSPAALPSFHIYLKTDGGNATLVFEPYYQIVGNPATGVWATWDVDNGKFWTTSSNVNGMTPEGGGSYAGNKSWADIVGANPTAEFIGYGWGQGTYNNGTVALIQDLKVKSTKKGCKVHKWSTRFCKPSSSPTGTPSGTVLPTTPAGTVVPTTPVATTPVPTTEPPPPTTPAATVPPTSPNATPSPEPSDDLVVPPPNNGDASRLPKTGSPVAVIVGTGGSLLAVGLAFVWWLTRNRGRHRVRFTTDGM